jgi:hypothetical protein
LDGAPLLDEHFLRHTAWRGIRKNARALTCFRHAVLDLRWFRQDLDVTASARDTASAA